MNNVVSISRDDELLEAASRWVLKLDEGELSEGDEAALGAWLDESVEHRESLMEVASVWDRADTLARLAELFPRGSEHDRVKRGFGYRPWAQGFAAAGVLAVLIAVGLMLPTSGGDKAPPTTAAEYATAVGEQKTLLLPDSSEVVLNTNSQLTVTLTPDQRLLRLAQGEILVRVAEDHTRPLSVLAGNQIIQAVGTEFVVAMADDHHVELLVTEGKVAIGTQSVMAPSPRVRDINALDSLALPPLLGRLDGGDDNIVAVGELVSLGTAEPVKKTVSSDDIAAKLSWREGRLTFRSEPLEQALKEVERYTTVEFVFLDESLKTRALSGRFRVGDVEALLSSLRMNFDIAHEFDGESRVLLSSL